ncbi:hypothetical protein QL285_024985 [Trifolium repens]|nr:hypothetical protein QL285_024985 [Trifolium repens]
MVLSTIVGMRCPRLVLLLLLRVLCCCACLVPGWLGLLFPEFKLRTTCGKGACYKSSPFRNGKAGSFVPALLKEYPFQFLRRGSRERASSYAISVSPPSTLLLVHLCLTIFVSLPSLVYERSSVSRSKAYCVHPSFSPRESLVLQIQVDESYIPSLQDDESTSA